MPKQLTWMAAIRQVLNEAEGPLHYTEITERIVGQGLRHDLGATPAATVAAQISSSIKRDGLSSPYRRISRGVYALRAKWPAAASAPGEEPTPAEDLAGDTEEQYDIVTSFGMYWRRELVDWARRPRLLGQQPGATAVDFSEQYGIYLLYDGREVIYVGRVTDRGLGARLFEHTVDRLAARWDRFSWFGLRPVSSEGALGYVPAAFEGAQIIPALEAILVEAVEPRQNRKRGDDLLSVEFIQQEDPALANKRLVDGVVQALNR